MNVSLPQWQRGQQSSMSQRNSVPSGQEGVSIAEQLTFVAEMNTSSFTFTHWCNTHFSCGDCHTSPTYKQTQIFDKREYAEVSNLSVHRARNIFPHLFKCFLERMFGSCKGGQPPPIWCLFFQNSDHADAHLLCVIHWLWIGTTYSPSLKHPNSQL